MVKLLGKKKELSDLFGRRKVTNGENDDEGS